MSKNFECFLAQNVLKVDAEEVIVSKRFIDADGNIVKWKVGPITEADNKMLKKKAKTRISGKYGQSTVETDHDKYLVSLTVACTLYPDLTNKELQQSYGTNTPEELITTMLLPGEFTDYAVKVQEICGFEMMEETVEDVKN